VNSVLRFNENCFVTRRKCNRYFEASKRCFVACPSREKVGYELSIIEDKCKNHNIEPYIAVDHRTPGKDVFCEKICGQIIESKFCVVLLKDDIEKKLYIPNPNVYQEYGLMIGLQKKIIPLQEEGHPLHFNIQGIDTIIYNPSNFAMEIEKAIKTIIIEPPVLPAEAEKGAPAIPRDLTIVLGLKDLLLVDIFKSSDARTLFEYGGDLGFFLFENRKNRFLCYVGLFDKMDESEILLNLSVLIKRLEGAFSEIDTSLRELEKEYSALLPHTTEIIAVGYRKREYDLSVIKDLLTRTLVFLYVKEDLDKNTFQERYRKIKTVIPLPELQLLSLSDIKTTIAEAKKNFMN